MNGSEKQIKWASEIKQDMLTNIAHYGINDMIEKEISSKQRAIERGKTGDEQSAKIADLNEMKTAVEAQESADWFIDNRGILNGNKRWDVVVKTITGSDSKWVEFVQNRK